MGKMVYNTCITPERSKILDNKSLYLKTKPSKLFWKVTIPGGISMLMSSIYMIFDALFVGKFVGTTAFAAFGLAIPVIIVNFALSDLIAVGAAVPISIFLGEKEDEKANNYFTCSSIMIVCTGFLMGALIYFTAPLFMKLMHADGELARLAIQYMRIYAVFSPATTMTFAVDNFLRISGRLKTSMVLNIGMSLGTVILEAILVIFVQGGIVGAALSANIPMVVCSAVGFSMFLGGNLQLKLTKPKFSGKLVGQIIKNGMPIFLTNISGRIFSIVMNIRLLALGGEAAVAIYGVLMTLGSVVEMLLYGVLDSLQPAIGYNYGAKNMDRVKTFEKYCLIGGSVISLSFAVLFFVIPGPLVVPFLENMSLLDLAKSALRLFSFSYLYKWVSLALRSFFVAIEKPFPATCISVASAFAFPISMIAALWPLGLNGLWLNYPAAELLSAVLAVMLIFVLKNRILSRR